MRPVAIYLVGVMAFSGLAISCASDKASDQETTAPMQLVIVGPPGAGKGTQAKKIHEKYGIPHISTGDILRKEVASGTELGERVKGIMELGELVDDAIVLGLVEARLAKPDCANGFILDGFPRTIPQAEGLEEILSRQAKGEVVVIDIMVPDEALMSRLLARQRADDTRETIENRIRVYHEQTAPLIAYYEDRGALLTVDGDQPIEDVFAEISTHLTPKER
jgi:adenylate kinase